MFFAMKKTLRFVVILLLLIGLLDQQAPARAAKYDTRAVVQMLRKVSPNETVTQFKRHLPRQTQYQWKGSTARGDWTWNVLRFQGVRGGVELSGVAVFANNRAKYARLRPAANDAQRKQMLQTATAWRIGDQLHSVHIFLGDERKVYKAEAIDRDTKRQMNAVIRMLGQPQHKGHERYGQGPEDAGWSATWKLSRGRTLRFAETLALLDSAIRPSLELTFSYSQMYRA